MSEYARKFVYPDGITHTVWPRVEARGRAFGLEFDWWQQQLNTVILGYRDDGIYAASVGGVGLSIPRQVGKTFNVLALLVIMCDLFPGLQVLWTSHHMSTTGKTFQSLQGLCKRKRIEPLISGVRVGNGDWTIKFVNGSAIQLGARSRGFGRGFDEIDIEVFDEAQILDVRALEDMLAATNQATHEHGALLVFMGTPPRPLDPSEAFAERRAEAWAGESEDSIWLEIGADPKSDPNDRSQWPKMNPSFPKRTPETSIRRLRKNLKNEDSWNREGRGVWNDDMSPAVWKASDWIACQGSWAVGQMDVSGLALAVSYDRDWSAIVVAAKDEDGATHVRPIRHRAGTGWTVDDLKAAQERTGLDVIVDPRSPADALIPVLERAGVSLRLVKTDEAFTACATIDQLVRAHELRHADYEALNGAVERAELRIMNNGRALWRRKSGVDISSLEAASLATYQANNPEQKVIAPPPDIF